MTAIAAPPIEYRAFLEAKAKLATGSGFPCTPDEVNPILKPFQRDIVAWAVRGGRRALFEKFGLGKTMQQLETVRLTLQKLAAEDPHRVHCRGLIVLPLGVRQEFARDAATLGLTVRFIRTVEEADATGIYLTNYESVREGKLDPTRFDVVSLDEAGVLRGFGGTKTFREFMGYFEGSGTYRFVATATPSPNEFIELLAYSAFLDVMDVGQAKTRFFKRNSEQADHLTLHPHKEREFWLWVASWAIFVQTPSDLGYSDEGYELPPLEKVWHVLPTDHSTAGTTTDGQGRLFANAALGVVDASREKRNSLDVRVAKVLEIVRGREGAESEAALVASLPRIPEEVPAGLLPPHERESDRAAQFDGGAGLHGSVSGAAPREGESVSTDGSAQALRVDPGAVSRPIGETGLGVPDLHAAVGQSSGGSRPHDEAGEGSSLPQLQRGARPDGGQPRQPGAGDELPDQVVVWCDLNDEQRALEDAFTAAGISVSSLYGSQDLEVREELFERWRRRETTVFLSKTSMYGAGVNLQQCHTMVFAGIHYKFSEVIQACHRIHRFLQENACTVHLIYTEAESEVRATLERKWEQHEQLVSQMTAIVREYGLSEAAMASALTRSIGVERSEESGRDWMLVNNDCVEETQRMPADTVDLILTSIPFSTMYQYSPSYNDFGHTDDGDHFWQQMDFLTPQLLRVLKPGRNLVVHVKDRIVPAGMTKLGFATVQAFHCDAIAHYQRHGFGFLGMRTIVTDVVRENNQTYRLGWTEQCKDGTRMGVGMPEYLLLFRKPPTDRSNGYADEPVVKEKPLVMRDDGTIGEFDKTHNWRRPVPGTGYSRGRWQLDAHGFWRSSGQRLLSPSELESLPHSTLYKLWRDRSRDEVYDPEGHVTVVEELDHLQRLPAGFMLLPPHSWHPDVWTDVARMRTLNGSQWSKGKEMHLCPLQFDIVDRVINQMSMPGELVMDPFSGLGTVALRALQLGRQGLGIELNPQYHADAVAYLKAAEQQVTMPTLFDLDEPNEEMGA